jgi:hypothetical protein
MDCTYLETSDLLHPSLKILPKVFMKIRTNLYKGQGHFNPFCDRRESCHCERNLKPSIAFAQRFIVVWDACTDHG